MLAVIPYTTFPLIELGPVHLRTFGLMVGIGVVLGAWIAAKQLEPYGVSRDDTYRLATRLVVGGMIGARLTWDLSHWDQIDSPLDLIAVWKGGLQFSGGFIAAVLVGFPAFRKMRRTLRWRAIDAYAYGLTIGLAWGRVGCTAVGEHFGRTSDFFLAVRYDGGDVRESEIGKQLLVRGMTFHNTAIYELIFLVFLFAALTFVIYRKPTRPAAGTVIGIYCIAYGIFRFFTETLRVNDKRVALLTGAQLLMLSLVPIGLWILYKVRPEVAAAAALEAAEVGEPEPGDADAAGLEAPEGDDAELAGRSLGDDPSDPSD